MMWILVAPLAVLAVLYALVFGTIQSGAYALDPQDAGSGAEKGRGTFEPHNKNYLEMAKLVIGLGSASIGAVAIFFVQKEIPARGLQGRMAWPLTWFVASVVYGVAFIGLMVWRYEHYCHRPGSYTRPWYALVTSLGLSMLVCVATGYFVFVWILLHP